MQNDKRTSIGEICSAFLIRNDVETILSFMKTERDPVFSMSILPYYALFYHSCSEYLKLSLFNNEIQTQIVSIRHYIKALSDGFGKSSKRVGNTDEIQNENFRNQLRFDFLRDINIHYNLGVYFNNKKKMICNTQFVADCFGIENIFEPKQEDDNKQFKIGKELGSFVASISRGFEDSMTPPKITRLNENITIPLYHDLNTNKPDLFFNKSNDKTTSLFFLYLLCNMNFVSEILETLVPIENTWVFRVKYIVNYYAVRALERYKNYCLNNKCKNELDEEFDEILTFADSLFKSEFRNCMMHYGITDQVKIEYFNLDKPLFGLVESCFEGMDFYSFSEKQDIISKRIITYLEKQFDVDTITLERL